MQVTVWPLTVAMRENGIDVPKEHYGPFLIERFWQAVLDSRRVTIEKIRDWNHRCIAFMANKGLSIDDYIGYLHKTRMSSELNIDWPSIEEQAKKDNEEWESILAQLKTQTD